MSSFKQYGFSILYSHRRLLLGLVIDYIGRNGNAFAAEYLGRKLHLYALSCNVLIVIISNYLIVYSIRICISCGGKLCRPVDIIQAVPHHSAVRGRSRIDDSLGLAVISAIRIRGSGYRGDSLINGKALGDLALEVTNTRQRYRWAVVSIYVVFVESGIIRIQNKRFAVEDHGKRRLKSRACISNGSDRNRSVVDVRLIYRIGESKATRIITLTRNSDGMCTCIGLLVAGNCKVRTLYERYAVKGDFRDVERLLISVEHNSISGHLNIRFFIYTFDGFR